MTRYLGNLVKKIYNFVGLVISLVTKHLENTTKFVSAKDKNILIVWF